MALKIKDINFFTRIILNIVIFTSHIKKRIVSTPTKSLKINSLLNYMVILVLEEEKPLSVKLNVCIFL